MQANKLRARESLVVFEVAAHRFALRLRDAGEAVRVPRLTVLPDAPEITEGVVDLRGTIVPVLDFRLRFDLPAKPVELSDRLLTAKVGSTIVAFRVDRVLGIETAAAEEIDAGTDARAAGQRLTGIARLETGLILIHDPNTFLWEAEQQQLARVLAGGREAVS